MYAYQSKVEKVIRLNDLFESFEISPRTYNVCQKYALLELPQLIDFYLNIEDFTILQGAGRKTHEELEKICRHFLNQRNDALKKAYIPEEKLEEQSQIAFIDPANLTQHQLQVLESYVRQRFQELPVRGRNALKHFLNERVSYITIHRLFFVEGVPVTKLRNIGLKTIGEIEIFFADLKSYASEITARRDGDLIFEFLIRHISPILNLSPDFWKSFHPSISESGFPLFTFLQKLVLGGHLFNNTGIAILRYRMGWFVENNVLGLEEIGMQVGLSRERVRQIANSLQESLYKKFEFLRIHKSQLLELTSNYGLDINKDLVFVRQNVATEINNKEGTCFTRKFFAQIFSFLHSDTHLLFGEQFDFFQNHYLIKRGLADAFNFEAFAIDLREQTKQRIKDDLEIDLDGYLYSFLKTNNLSALVQVRPVCEDLLLLEFNEEIRVDFDNLVLCRNTKMQVWEYAYDALEKIGKPAKLAQIHEIIVAKYPMFDTSLEGLRGALVGEKTHFISFSRTSTYGLAKWETEREDIRGGTIRDIAREYLQQFSEPKHYYDITDFVLQYRPTTSPKSVHGNLQADESERFREFPGGFWGLFEKNYGNFKAKQLPKFTRSLVSSFIVKSADPSLLNLVAYLSNVCGVQPAQIRAWVDYKIRIGILRLENDKLVILK